MAVLHGLTLGRSLVLTHLRNCFCLVGTQVKTQASMSYAESISTPGGYPKHCRVNFLKMQVGRMGVDGAVW